MASLLASTSSGLLLELVFDPADRGIHRAVVEPVAHPQREEILAAVHGLGVQAEMFKRPAREALEFDGEEAELVERMIFQRIRGHLRLAQIVFLEAVGIDDQDPVGLQVRDIDLQRRGIHGDQHVDGVARSEHVVGRKVQLVAADAGQRAGRSANLRGVVRERGDVVAVKRDRIGELAAGDLHAVAGVPGEADDRLSITSGLVFEGGSVINVDMIAEFLGP